MTKASISALSLNVNDPEGLAQFYCEFLGMRRLEADDAVAVGYGKEGAVLNLIQASAPGNYHPGQQDRYWKIAITLPDLDFAHAQLCDRGISSTTPHQFRDIAYMSHLADPEGHVIELIQHSFEGNPRTRTGDNTAPLGGGAEIGLITLRTDNIETDLTECREDLGMRYLSRQAVTDRGFDLYFLGLCDETQPNSDVNAIENREWLWQRPYTVLEFQHLLNGSVLTRPKHATGAGSLDIQHADGTETVFR